ncbi:SO_0444 family Cu/Zn efflux transporter [Colwellia sp. D2M02]|uniref:SO_0444 family Cu/Zn efflux transporter n=1 Tax=Colwellia sp. D2M02 TaxID=2841562 RepID=UPI001C08C234|nr:SO_0444 family Cu/Zn efflux transporter [Colwellia sp. D2M02]MBU2893344.1 SO_0444 family Cu/Zn efflux transporter [Colwellia sp. D2M02]
MLLLDNFWQLFVLSAPWLLLGLFIAGVINVYLPERFLVKHLGKEGLLTTIKAAFIGAPLPLCSCGVIPAAIGLRRAGASKSATTAFLVSTPETGVDSISVSYVLLGPFMAIIRPIAAISSAIVAGLLVGSEKSSDTPKPSTVISNTSNDNSEKPSTCCASKKAETSEQSSCASENTAQKSTLNHKEKLQQALSFSCTKLLADTAKWLMLGLFFAALVQTYVPADFFTQWGQGILAMLVVILISIPMYVCATASTPIAAGLLLSGVSPGAVLVFMLAGPATNIATIGVVATELGKRAMFAYLVAVIGVALAFGYLTDFLVSEYGFTVAPLLGEHHHAILPYWLEFSMAVLLAALLLRLVFKTISTKLANRVTTPKKSCCASEHKHS